MNDKQRDGLTAYIRVLADAMRLRDWDIDLSKRQPNADDSAAQVRCIYGQKHAFVFLPVDWFDQAPEKQRECLVHELLHCHLEPAASLVRRTNETVKKYYLEVMQAAHTEAIEHAIDALSIVIAPFLPLPGDG